MDTAKSLYKGGKARVLGLDGKTSIFDHGKVGHARVTRAPRSRGRSRRSRSRSAPPLTPSPLLTPPQAYYVAKTAPKEFKVRPLADDRAPRRMCFRTQEGGRAPAVF